MCNPVLISLTANFYKSNPFMYFAEKKEYSSMCIYSNVQVQALTKAHAHTFSSTIVN